MTLAPDAALVQSLRIGDHEYSPYSRSKAAAGLAALVAGGLAPRRGPGRGRTGNGGADPAGGRYRVLFTFAAPMAHGAELLHDATAALDGRATAWFDEKQADTSTIADHDDFPSLSPKSMFRRATPVDLASGLLFLFRNGRAAVTVLPRSHRLARWYLVWAQGCRRRIASRWMRALDPGLVVADMDLHATCAPVVVAARMQGTTTATLVHGSPSENYLPILADAVLTWSALQSEWFSGRTDAELIEVGQLAAEPVLPPASQDIFVIAASREVLSPDEVGRLVSLVDRAHAEGARCVLRHHPVALTAEGAASWRPVAERVDEVTLGGSPDWLRESSTVVGLSSTAVIDAVSAGRSVAVVADDSRPLPCELAYLREACGDRVVPASAIRDVVVPHSREEAARRLRSYVDSVTAPGAVGR